MTPLFCTLDSQRIADLIHSAERVAGCAGQGMRIAPARAIAEEAERLWCKVLQQMHCCIPGRESC